MPAKHERLEDLSIEKLQKRIQKQLEQPWARLEKAVKANIAPLLYYLRKKLHAPGNRSGKGWAMWVGEKLSISVRTCNRWASEYAEQHGLPAFAEDESTSRQLAGGSNDNDQVQISAYWIGTRAEKQRFLEAWDELGEQAGHITFDAVTAAAAKKGASNARPKARVIAAA